MQICQNLNFLWQCINFGEISTEKKNGGTKGKCFNEVQFVLFQPSQKKTSSQEQGQNPEPTEVNGSIADDFSKARISVQVCSSQAR